MEQGIPYYNEVGEQVGVHGAVAEANSKNMQNQHIQYQMEEAEKNLAESQLDVHETLSKIYHLLKQDVLKPDEQGILNWIPITDMKKRVLTDEGVDKIMQIVQSYVNKETLLSNFDDKMIARRMLEFSLGLSALFFMKYEIFFRSPTLEECQDILSSRVDEKVSKKRMTCKLLMQSFDEEQTRREILDLLEPRVEYELKKIKEEQKRFNLKEFEMIFIQIRALVEATHNRAWKGEERGSLRRHFNISEVIGGKPQGMEKKGGGSWFGFGN